VKYVRIPTPAAGQDMAIDANTYLESLPQLAPSLPAGARAFATDLGHYDFFGPRCVKDLKFGDLTFDNAEEETIVVITFRHNCWKHEEDLTVRYTGVHDVSANVDMRSHWRRMQPEVILDEILPHPHGCSHEIAMHGGSIFITCRDLTADWADADCPDKPAGDRS